MILVPKPKEMLIKTGSFKFESGNFIYIPTKSLFTSAKKLKDTLKNLTGVELFISLYNGAKTIIEANVNRNKVKNHSGYIIEVENKKIKITANNVVGIHYALMTLIQLVRNYGRELPQLEIFDYPDINNRGFLLDISRDKVPKLETLFELIDLLSELKYNQLQLYTEHTFAYQSHETVWKDYSPLSGEDILILDNYCKERFIELVPNQASFGHMEKWLIHDEYSYLAETFEFVTPWGEYYNTPFSLSPAIDDSIKFLDSLYSELLPHFSSKLFNINGDETFDLCQGKSKRMCEKLGKGNVYLNFILKIYELVKKYNKQMMMWADIIKNYPELISNLPNDIIFLIWGYEKDHDFEKECSLFKKHEFYVCPGTSSWNSIIGRLDNAIENIKNAVSNGLKYKTSGVLLTDWGDNGHWQHLPISLPEIIYASGVSWGFNENKNLDLIEALSLYIEKTAAEIIVNIGNVYKLLDLQIPNSNLFALVFISPKTINKQILDKLSLESLNEINQILNEQSKKTNGIKNDLIKMELKNAIELSILSTEILISLKIANSNNISKLLPVTKEEFALRLEKIIENYEKIWNTRNRPGGLKQSVEKLRKILKYLSK